MFLATDRSKGGTNQWLVIMHDESGPYTQAICPGSECTDQLGMHAPTGCEQLACNVRHSRLNVQTLPSFARRGRERE